jgi:dimethylamine/trimethylamine dehydrogenase
VKQRIIDFIGAARPSIADPFLPAKIDEGRLEDIRECIGCNICVSGDMTQSLSRCTQNSAFMEEWRKGWHPEQVQPKKSERRVLVVGSGPAGLSAAMKLGQRGYDVALAELGRELGGRVTLESRLPGLSAWARVRDYRAGQINKLAHVAVYRESEITADDALEFGFSDIVVATGAKWRRDGVARWHTLPIPIDAAMPIFTPDDIMAGRMPQGHVFVYDDDHYYMASVIADLLIAKGCKVSFATPASKASEWSVNTLEQGFIQRRLIDNSVELHLNRALNAISAKEATLACAYTGAEIHIACDAVAMVCSRLPNDKLYRDLVAKKDHWADHGINSVTAIGDSLAPAPIAWATYAGFRYAEEFDAPERNDELPFKRLVVKPEAVHA